MLSEQYYELPFEMCKLTSLICAHLRLSYANACTGAFTIVPISSTKAPPIFYVSLPSHAPFPAPERERRALRQLCLDSCQ